VGHEHDADAAIPVQLLKDVQDVDGSACVQVTGRLVGQQQSRVNWGDAARGPPVRP
jgi:hypothetical protein